MTNNTGKKPVAISCGAYHTIVLMDDGSVYGTGFNGNGQLGIGSNDSQTILTLMTSIPEEKTPIAISCGGLHTIVLMDDGSVYGTGTNYDGQLGNGDENDQTTLTPMTIGNGITRVTNVSRLFDTEFYLVFTEEASCLLEGTLVWTNKGYLPIETLKPGDTIETKKYYIAITKVGKWSVDLSREEDRNDLSNKMYKIPAGKYGAKRDTYISHYHRILYDLNPDFENDNGNHNDNESGFDIPMHLGLQPANPTEFTKDGKYNLYHLQLAVGRYYVVNGNCMVEAWEPEDKFF